MQSRSWRWLRTRIGELLDVPPTFTPNGGRVMGTRLGRALFPTENPKGE